MKTIKQGIIGALALLFTFAVHTFAIEGLQISVQCSNVVLSWPSVEGETYLVRYRPDLNSTSSWTVLTDYLPAASGANLTFFIHSNVVQYPNCGGGAMAMISQGAQTSSALAPTQPS